MSGPTPSSDLILTDEQIDRFSSRAWNYETPYPIKWLVMSIIKSGEGESERLAMNVWGIARDKEEALEMSKEVSEGLDRWYPVYVAPSGGWLPLPPNHKDVKDVESAHDFVNKLRNGLVEMEKAKSKLMRERIEADHAFHEEKNESVKEQMEENKRLFLEEEAKQKEEAAAQKLIEGAEESKDEQRVEVEELPDNTNNV